MQEHHLPHCLLTADIEKAFVAISVSEEDTDVLRFFWIDDVGNDLLPQDLCTEILPGGVWSILYPFLAKCYTTTALEPV